METKAGDLIVMQGFSRNGDCVFAVRAVIVPINGDASRFVYGALVPVAYGEDDAESFADEALAALPQDQETQARVKARVAAVTRMPVRPNLPDQIELLEAEMRAKQIPSKIPGKTWRPRTPPVEEMN